MQVHSCHKTRRTDVSDIMMGRSGVETASSCDVGVLRCPPHKFEPTEFPGVSEGGVAGAQLSQDSAGIRLARNDG